MKGDGRCSIDKQAKGIAGRGVLLDVAALHGVEWPAAGTVITPEELQAAAERQGGVHVGPGDILLVRTGWRRKFLTARDVAAVASDNWAVEVRELFFTVPPLKVTGGVGNADRSVGVEVMQQLGDEGMSCRAGVAAGPSGFGRGGGGPGCARKRRITEEERSRIITLHRPG